MRTYISDIIPRIQKFSQKLDNLTLLTNQHWVVIDDIDETKNVYIFRQNNELLISQNGKVEKAKWEYLGHNSLLIDRKNESYLFKHGFFDENILALKIDSKDEYALFVNESRYDKELNSFLSVVEFLKKKYIQPCNKKSTKKHPEVSFERVTKLASKKLTIHQAPKYKITKTVKTKRLSGNVTVKHSIIFDDSVNGVIYLKQKSNQAFFKVNNNGSWASSIHNYKNIDSCINALHYFKKTGEILEYDYVQ
jgi:hypothetical protein